jgi:hypothetical protein
MIPSASLQRPVTPLIRQEWAAKIGQSKRIITINFRCLNFTRACGSVFAVTRGTDFAAADGKLDCDPCEFALPEGAAVSSSEERDPSSQGTHQADVLLHVEQEAPNKFKIESDQLEQIGLKLRGPRRFSVFNSIVLPALVTLLTTILTGTFQYVSWINTVRLQDASSVADRAAETFDKAASLIGQRRYATLIFIPSARDLVQSQPAAASPNAKANRTSRSSAAIFDTASREIPADAVTPTPAPARPLAKTNFELLNARYNSYYDKLKQWNEGYDQLIAEIDGNLDRPILADAGIAGSPVTIFQKQISAIRCDNSLLDELEKAHLNKNSLKLQFAIINRCFQGLHNILDDQLTKVLKHAADNIDQKVITDANNGLNYISTTANVFRCFALFRIKYYKSQKQKSILVPDFVRRWLFDPNKSDAMNEFQNEQTGCNADNRPT